MRDRIKQIHDRIRNTAISCGRDPKTIRLVVVSKTKPAKTVKEAIAAGATILGENYIQEAKEKIETISKDLVTKSVSWHFIGHLQTNKAKYAVKLFDCIQSVDSLKLAKELNKQAKKHDKIQKILLQVNIGKESTKSGVLEQDTLELVESVSTYENLSVRGLMTMPPFFNDPERVQPFFASLRHLRDVIAKKKIPNIHMDELSMGMTGDFEAAIREGATFVRIGTAIFGKRN